MNRSLLARTDPKFYAEFINGARMCGISDELIDAEVARSICTAQSLLDGKCPQCGAPSAQYVDYKLQQGDSDVPGAWVMYRCSTAPPPGQLRPKDACDFLLDLKEGEASN